MCKKSFVSWCCVFLFFTSPTNPLRNFTNDNKRDNNSTIRLQLHANFTKENDNETNFNRDNLLKEFIDDENAQYVSRINSRSNDRKDDNLTQNQLPAHYAIYYKDGNHIPVKRETNFTEVDNKENFDNNENEKRNYKIVPYETCHNSSCIRLCCDNRTDYDTCTPYTTIFPNIRNYSSDSMEGENKKENEVFQLTVFPSQFQDGCQNRTIIGIPLFEQIVHYEYFFFKNGTLYLPYFNEFIESSYYCLAFNEYNNQFGAVICLEAMTEIIKKEHDKFKEVRYLKWGLNKLHISCSIISMLCMLIIFLVYSILPELQNIHSFMLRRFTSLTFMLYMIHISNNYFEVEESVCVAMALIKYFIYVANFLWLSVMSFDMWYNFRDIRSLQRKVKQGKKKKYIYSIFVWGSAFILTIIITIMNYAPGVPEIFRPSFSAENDCWLNSNTAKQLYGYGPICICVFISIFLSIYTALKIARYEKDTAVVLKNTESQCYSENKKRFNLYLKFFIVLFVIKAIHLIIATALEFGGFTTFFNFAMALQWEYVWSCIIVLKHIQNICMVIIFVCKKKIIRLLLKRFC